MLWSQWLTYVWQLRSCCSRRRLKDWKVYTSCNHNAGYHVLTSVPSFDEHGIWRYNGIFFSRHGNITQTIIKLVNDSSTGSFGTFKVSVGAPLTVTDVAWGRTPLPPKPVWLLVECADKRRGFIPTNYSYTNVLAGKRFARLPWESEILEQNPREANKWDEAIWEMIDSHNVAAGMSTAQVRLAWGEPRSMEQDSAASTIRWVYEAQTLTFVRDSLVAE